MQGPPAKIKGLHDGGDLCGWTWVSCAMPHAVWLLLRRLDQVWTGLKFERFLVPFRLV